MTDIIVLTYGNEDLSKACFRSLRKHTKDYRVIWIDNGSGLESVEQTKPEAFACNNVKPFWLRDNLGFIKGTNLALKYALESSNSEYICLLNNDVEVTEGWLDRMIKVLERNFNAGAVGPITSECNSWQSCFNAQNIVPVFSTPYGFRKGSLDERANMLASAYGELSAKCNMLAFFCTVFRRKVFLKIGLLDEGFGVGYGDDDDFSYRMRQAGFDVLLSMGTYVFHNHQSTFKKLYTDKEICDLKKEKLAVFKAKHGIDAKV